MFNDVNIQMLHNALTGRAARGGRNVPAGAGAAARGGGCTYSITSFLLAMMALAGVGVLLLQSGVVIINVSALGPTATSSISAWGADTMVVDRVAALEAMVFSRGGENAAHESELAASRGASTAATAAAPLSAVRRPSRVAPRLGTTSPLSAVRKHTPTTLHFKDDVLTDHAESSFGTRPLVQPSLNPLRNFHDRFSGGGMTSHEQDVLARAYANAESVFEWGMGSSTLIAAHVGIERLTAVDSAPIWVDQVRTILNQTTYTFRHADVGPISSYGNPKDESNRLRWPGYSLQVTLDKNPFDVYLVDGRFRVACACQALLHGRSDSLVLVHDFFRHEYEVVLTLADMVKRENMLAVLRKKNTTSDDDINTMWEQYKYVTN